MNKTFTLFLSIFLFFTYTLNFAQLKTAEAFPGLTFDRPVEIADPNDGSNKLYVVNQDGIIYSFDNNASAAQKKTFLNLSAKIVIGGEQGLLGLAFHPDYKDSGYLYVNYITNQPAGTPRRSVVSRFKVNPARDAVIPESEMVILQTVQPYENHNGGKLAFGPDGYLYISFGDGGGSGDPDSNAQNLETFLGKILRIDVNNISDSALYHIPADNPFKGNSSGYKEEIFAYGLRNVWKFSFDPENGDLWAGDVGQDTWEEVNIIKSGGNYGWNIMEGKDCYSRNDCDTANKVLPVWVYGHNNDGGESITGGVVYRGNKLPSLKGKYIYGDYVSGKIWSLEKNEGAYKNTRLFSSQGSLSAFAVDSKGNLLFADYYTGKIMKIQENSVSVKEPDKPIVPEKETLAQNYPNPFNPETTITFYMDKSGFAKLEVYNMLGKKIETLFEGTAKYGTNSFTWNSGSQPSGVYFYKLTTESASVTKKMILEK